MSATGTSPARKKNVQSRELMSEPQADIDVSQRIRDRAYQIWLQSGQPHGTADVDWLQAEAEILSTLKPAGDQI